MSGRNEAESHRDNKILKVDSSLKWQQSKSISENGLRFINTRPLFVWNASWRLYDTYCVF